MAQDKTKLVFNPLTGNFDAVQDVSGLATTVDLNTHINNPTDAHDASAISSIPSGNLSATDVQSALNELQSDIDTRALDSVVIKKDGSVNFTANQSMGGFNLTGLATPVSGSDAATKTYVDNVAEGLRPKTAVRVATTSNITLSGTQTIDGVSVVANDRVLVKDQTLAQNNGIYDVKVGAWTRSADFDQLSPVDEINGAFVAVQEGTTNGGKLYVQFGTVSSLGTDPINFTFFNSIATLIGGDGITISGSNVSVDHDGQGLQFIATQLALELDGTTLSKSSSGLKLSDTAVSPGTYGSSTQVSQIVVDQQGRLTSAQNTSIAIPSTQVTDFTEAAQDSVGNILNSTSTITLTYDDTLNSIYGQVNNGSIGNTQLSTNIDAAKIANGTVSNTEFQYLDGVTSSIQTQLDSKVSSIIGDILPTSFSINNNQSSATNVTSLAFANGVTKSFKALVDIRINATTPLYELYEIQGIQRGSDWIISQTSEGDSSGLVFSITSTGQIQYMSPSYPGFVSGTLKFKAHTIPV